MAALVKPLSFSSTIFSGLKAKKYLLSGTPEFEGFLSYISVENGVATYKEVEYATSGRKSLCGHCSKNKWKAYL